MRRSLLILGIVALGWAALVAIEGRIVLSLGFAVLRSRSVARPLAIGVASLVAYVLIDRRGFLQDVGSLPARMRLMAPVLAAAAAFLLCVHAVRHGTYTAGGADSYGYLDQAYKWWNGQLPAPVPIPLALPLPFSDLLQTPLGYGPGPEPHTMVPTYAPGLPLIMAASLVFGPCGPFAVVPLAAVVFVLATYFLGVRVAGPLTGLLAAFFVASSPTVLFQATWPMSDVPSGALWTLALLASLGRTKRTVAVAGALTALGLLVRPNLLPLAAVPFGCVLMGVDSNRERVGHATVFVVPVAVVALFVAAINVRWYGSPLRSGYGSLGDLYSLHSIWPNLQHYSAWLWHSQSPVVLIAFLPLLPWLSPASMRRAATPMAVMSCLVLLCYIAYLPFDAWWYLRFLLPGAGAFAVLTAIGFRVFAKRVPFGWAIAATVLLYGAWGTVGFSRTSGLFGGLPGERRYAAAGQYVGTLPPNAVVFAFLHSGSVRFYGGRQSLRYEYIARQPQEAARALEQVGLHPYLLIDDGEAPDVRRHFNLPDGPLPWPLAAHLDDFNGVSLYDMTTAPEQRRTVSMSPNTDPLCRLPLPVVVEARRGSAQIQ